MVKDETLLIVGAIAGAFLLFRKEFGQIFGGVGKTVGAIGGVAGSTGDVLSGILGSGEKLQASTLRQVGGITYPTSIPEEEETIVSTGLPPLDLNLNVASGVTRGLAKTFKSITTSQTIFDSAKQSASLRRGKPSQEVKETATRMTVERYVPSKPDPRKKTLSSYQRRLRRTGRSPFR